MLGLSSLLRFLPPAGRGLPGWLPAFLSQTARRPQSALPGVRARGAPGGLTCRCLAACRALGWQLEASLAPGSKGCCSAYFPPSAFSPDPEASAGNACCTPPLAGVCFCPTLPVAPRACEGEAPCPAGATFQIQEECPVPLPLGG